MFVKQVEKTLDMKYEPHIKFAHRMTDGRRMLLEFRLPCGRRRRQWRAALTAAGVK